MSLLDYRSNYFCLSTTIYYLFLSLSISMVDSFIDLFVWKLRKVYMVKKVGSKLIHNSSFLKFQFLETVQELYVYKVQQLISV